jgi:hypothetical protein
VITKTECKWSCSDPDWNTWNTCNTEWQITEGTPLENGMLYCPFCGRKLVEAEEKEDA